MEEEIGTSGFYKWTGTEWLYAIYEVGMPTYTLLRENKDNYTYPVDGWVWYEEKPNDPE